MSYINKQVHLFIEKQFPAFYREQGPLLVKFIEYYYKWLEESGNAIDVSRSLATYRDVEDSPNQFFKFLRSEFMKNVPHNTLADERLLIRHIVDFYKAKGSEDAYRLLFRILYGDETIEFYYPGQDILRVSDGRWVVDRSLTLGNIQVSPVTSANSYSTIRGGTSSARAELLYYLEHFESSVYKQEIYLTNIFGTFQQDEILYSVASNTALATVTSAGIITHSGRYVGTNGFLSWDKYLQDNHYYQEYSYVIKSSQPVANYRESVKNLLHPSGTQLFGQILVKPEIVFPVLDTFIVTIGQSSNSALKFISSIDPFDPIQYALTDGYSDTEFLDHHLKLIIESKLDPSFDFALAKNRVAQGDGWIGTSNSISINTYANYTLRELGDVPMNLTGTKRLIIGTRTHFKTQLYSNNTVIPTIALDSVNHDGKAVFAGRIYSNTFFKATEDYPYDQLFKQPYTLLSEANSTIIPSANGMGVVSIYNKPNVQQYATYSLGYLAKVPIYAVGKQFLVEGTGGANFTAESAYPNTIFKINDSSKNANTIYAVKRFFSNNFVEITGPYFYANTYNQPYVIYNDTLGVLELDFSQPENSGLMILSI